MAVRDASSSRSGRSRVVPMPTQGRLEMDQIAAELRHGRVMVASCVDRRVCGTRERQHDTRSCKELVGLGILHQP